MVQHAGTIRGTDPAPTSAAAGDAAPAARLGELLRRAGRVERHQVDEALADQRRTGQLLGETLRALGHVQPAAVTEALVEQWGLERVDAEAANPPAETLGLIDADLAGRCVALPLEVRGGRLRVAMADPFDAEALEALRLATGLRLEPVYSPEADLREAIRKRYGSGVARMIANLDPGEARGSDASSEDTDARTLMELQELAREPSVVNLVNLILLEGIEAGASDIHIEPFEKVLRVKYRIDGVLQEVSPPPRHLYSAIVSRVKIMGGMNIAERFIPQDGHIAFQAPRGGVDIRVGTVPTVFGESVALRLLDKSIGLIDLARVGFPERPLQQYEELLTRPHGIILVTGPTGSGKTTTLYASLNRIFTPEKKIITIEDPVEYQLDGVNQIPVNRKRGVDFARGLRAILRQDPDVIMVGEIRDRETADIAIRAALTGHLVFSTLHTNDAVGAVSRLLDMGMEPFLLASCLEGVIAQRLVRRICNHCREPYDPPAEVLERLGRTNGSVATYFRGRGCRQCRQTGYRGRMGLFELLFVNEPIRRVIHDRGTGAEILAATDASHERMRQHGLTKAAAGETTVEEVLRVTQDTPTEEALETE